MYIKTLQNGNPLFWAYKLPPYDTSKPAQEEQKEVEPQGDYNSRFEKIEKQLDEIHNKYRYLLYKYFFFNINNIINFSINVIKNRII